MTNQTKRYLVTYLHGNMSTEEAVKVLGVSKTKFRDGVSFMATESIPTEKDVLHFESLGVSTIELTKEEADKLSLKEGVLAVEEDVEMFAIESTKDDEAQFNELFMNSDEMSDFQELKDDSYLKGYNKALLDVFASLLETSSLRNTEDFSRQISEKSSRPLTAQPVPWNINLVKAPLAWSRGITGRGVNVAILDSGIAPHSDLVISGGVSLIPGEISYNDLNGHGTHCAGIVGARNNSSGVVGVAPLSRLFAVKVLKERPDGGASGSVSWIIAGMEWCLKNKMKVISMSLGAEYSPIVAYANAIQRCQDNGVTVVIAAGNSFGTSFPWVNAPANSILQFVPNASPIAVGSIDRRYIISGFSSRGGLQPLLWNGVWCVAPGMSVNSTYLGDSYRQMSGTSMACPHVAGLAALIIQKYPYITPANVKRRIATTCKDLGSSSYDETYGYGIINCDLATR